MTNNRVNFTERHLHGGWAKYLPAISGFYTTHLGKDLLDPEFIPKERVPAKFELGMQGLNFLDEDNSYYNYKFGLYSAGHAERKLDKCDDREPMIHGRNREKTILIGDSGGFQIATGVIKLDWSKVMTPEGDKLREEILRYLEHTSDWSMTLDVPAFAALPPLSEKTGLTKFTDCLDVTEHNLKYFMEHRVPGATKFLNVLSGSSNETSRTWYDRVIPYSIPEVVEAMGYTKDRTLEGWAFAGVNMRDMKTVLERLIDLREDGLLAGKDWIHFLGIGRLDWACYLTSIERELKKYNPNINVSFDAASPFVAAGGYALSYDYNHFETDQLTYSMGRGLDNKALKGSKLGMTFQGPIMERCTVGDLCVMGPGDLNKHGKEGKTSWDTTTYAIVMAHNVYNHIQAVQEINRHADIIYATKEVDYRDWAKKKTKTPICNFLPNNIFYFNSFVKELFSRDADKAYQLLEDYAGHLDNISFKPNKIVDAYHTLFDFSEVDSTQEVSGQDIAGLDSEDLINIDEE
jgi:hypothetical protein